jgi:hypothetical protein
MSEKTENKLIAEALAKIGFVRINDFDYRMNGCGGLSCLGLQFYNPNTKRALQIWENCPTEQEVFAEEILEDIENRFGHNFDDVE